VRVCVCVFVCVWSSMPKFPYNKEESTSDPEGACARYARIITQCVEVIFININVVMCLVMTVIMIMVTQYIPKTHNQREQPK
jgi:hypothetical protein